MLGLLAVVVVERGIVDRAEEFVLGFDLVRVHGSRLGFCGLLFPLIFALLRFCGFCLEFVVGVAEVVRERVLAQSCLHHLLLAGLGRLALQRLVVVGGVVGERGGNFFAFVVRLANNLFAQLSLAFAALGLDRLLLAAEWSALCVALESPALAGHVVFCGLFGLLLG